VLKTPSVREQNEGQLTGTSPTNKNISKPALLGLTFPMPPGITVQEALVADLTAARSAALAKRDEASAPRRAAWRKFETAIYGEAAGPPPTEAQGGQQDEGAAEADD
jgi:type I restriction enzyme S subunit